MKRTFRSGVHTYDYAEDVLLFKIKDRDYARSLEFDNLLVDFDGKGRVMGMRLLDASKVFDLPKVQLKGIKRFSFSAYVQDGVISLKLRFSTLLRNKTRLVQCQDFVREARNVKDSSVRCAA